MPQRPIQHQISDKAVAKVREVWASIGAAVEEIRRDYGEDLLVQTCLKGKMDAARIWVQVKGASSMPHMRAGGKTKVRIPADLALRWARTADIFVLILWDIDNDIGWYSVPTLTELHGEPEAIGLKKIPLSIDSANLFNSETARLIAWDARLEHLSGFIRNYRAMQWEDYNEDDPNRGSWAEEAITEAVIDMMGDLNIVSVRSSRDQKISMNNDFHNLIIEQGGKEPAPSPGEAQRYVEDLVLISLLKQIDKEASCGVSTMILTEFMNILYALLNLRELVAFLDSQQDQPTQPRD